MASLGLQLPLHRPFSTSYPMTLFRRLFRTTTTTMLLWLLCTLPLALAQQPVPLGAIAYAVVGNQFVVQGGAILADVLNQQFWALDLSSSWSITSPAWKQLPNGPYNAYHTAIASVDNKTFITFGRDTGAVPSMIPYYFVNIFDFTTNTWSGVNPAGVQDTSRRDFAAVVNPNTQVAYITGGDFGVLGDQQANVFSVYDFAKKEVTETAIPPSGPRGPYTYGAAWLQNLNSMLMVGGQLAPSAYPNATFRYDAGKNTWSTQSTTGTFGYSRISPCAASNADGSKFVVYGGYVDGAAGGAADPAVYVLDTTTWHWTKYPQNGRGRGNAACALIGNQMIIWGGYYTIDHNKNEATPAPEDALMIVDITNGQWLTSYTPPAWLKSWGSAGPGGQSSTNTPGQGGAGGNGGGKLSTGAIAGIAGGVAVLVLALALFAFKRYRSRNKGKHGHQPLNGGHPSNKFDQASDASSTAALDPRYDHPHPHQHPHHHHHEDVMTALNPSGAGGTQPYMTGAYGAGHHPRPPMTPDRPFEERPLTPRSDGYMYAAAGGDPRHSYASTVQGRPTSFSPGIMADGQQGGFNPGLPRPLSNQRLSNFSGSTATPDQPSQHLTPLIGQHHYPPSSTFTAAAAPAAVADGTLPEMAADSGYIKPPPPMTAVGSYMSPSDPWGTTSPILTSGPTDSQLMFKNPQLYPEQQDNSITVAPPVASTPAPAPALPPPPTPPRPPGHLSGGPGDPLSGYDYSGGHPYQAMTSVPISSMFSPTVSNTGSSNASSASPYPTSAGLPQRSSFSGSTTYHDDGIVGSGGNGFGAVKVPVMPTSQPISLAGQTTASGNPQLYSQELMTMPLAGKEGELMSEARRASHPQGNNGYGATLM